MNKLTIFLGGTCNGSTWRDELIPKLNHNYFNPVVENWTPEAQAEELKQRVLCDICLYVITPKMTGFYSIAELIDDSIKRPTKTVFYFTTTEFFTPGATPPNCAGYISASGLHFAEHQIKSLKAIGKMVEANGGFWAHTEEDLLEKLNGLDS
jgi:hypothetical protein